MSSLQQGFHPECRLLREVKWPMARTERRLRKKEKKSLLCPSPSPHRSTCLCLQDPVPPGTLTPHITHSKPTSPRGHSSPEFPTASSHPWELSSLTAEMASEYQRPPCCSHTTEILPFQIWTPYVAKSDFRFSSVVVIVSTHVFWYFFVLFGLSQALPLLTLKFR